MPRVARSAARIAAWAAAFAIGLPAIAAALLLLAGNTGPGRRAIEHLIHATSGGALTIRGLSGRFPDDLRAAHAEIRDKAGVWARIDGLSLDWSPLRLLQGRIAADRLAAAQVAVLRRPIAAGGAIRLPLPVAIAHLHVARLALAAPVAGAAAALRADGRLSAAALDRITLALTLARLDKPGRYAVKAAIAPTGIAADVAIAEPAGGLLAGAARLPDLGALALTARLAGPRAAERAHVSLKAGPLHAAAAGSIDLTKLTADLDLSANAPAMAPRPGLSWQSARLAAHLEGPFARPDARGHVEIDGLAAGAATAGRLQAGIAGQGGRLVLEATATGLRLPGLAPELAGTAPLRMTITARLDRKARPVTFALTYPLLTVSGRIDTAGGIGGEARLSLPALAPFARLAGLDLRGTATARAQFSEQGKTVRVALSGAAGIAGGAPALLGLLGKSARFDLAGALDGDALKLDHAALDGAALRLSAVGAERAGALDFGWTLALPDLSRLAPGLAGALAASGRVQGPQRNFALLGQVRGRLGRPGGPPAPVAATLDIGGLPAAPAVRIAAQGRLAGAPLRLAAAGRRRNDGAWHLSVARALWKSASAQGEFTWSPGAAAPLGRVRLALARLGDLAALTGLPAGSGAPSGSAEAVLDLLTAGGKPQARLRLSARDLEWAGSRIAQMTAAGTIDDPLRRPLLSLRLALDGIAARAITGKARLDASGPAAAPRLRLSSDLRSAGGALKLSAAGTAQVAKSVLRLSALDAAYGGDKAHLLGPADLAWAGGLALDGLRIGIGKAVLTASGRLTPRLALALALRHAGPGLAAPFVPGLAARGDLALDARLAGTLAAPAGSVRIVGRGLRLRGGPAQGLPAADLDATAALAGGAARLDARLVAGSAARLHLAGTAPLRAGGPLALHARGDIDLALIDPLLAAEGRTLRGRLTLDAGIAGTPAAPRFSGAARLAGGGYRDLTQGIRLTEAGGTVTAEGGVLRLVRLAARAGAGTVSASGTLAPFAPGRPVRLTIAAAHARLPASGLVTADIDAKLSLSGDLAKRLSLAGKITAERADITIPDALPRSVAVLNVRRPGRRSPPAAAPEPVVGLAVAVAAPGRVFVRGHHLDAEMGGRLQVAGSSAAPRITGGFRLRRGSLDLAGQHLDFTSGRVTFDGGGLGGRLDPALDLTAESSANGIAATLRVTGYADAPKIALSSAPQLPQDEILARLLFGQSVTQLSAFQVAAIGQALVSLGGAGGLDPLAAVRKRLGLDRLSVGGAPTGGKGAAVTAGKYLTDRVFVGAVQGTAGGTQAQIQIDLTKHLKLSTTIGTHAAPPPPTVPLTPANDPGSNVGLTYQFEY